MNVTTSIMHVIGSASVFLHCNVKYIVSCSQNIRDNTLEIHILIKLSFNIKFYCYIKMFWSINVFLFKNPSFHILRIIFSLRRYRITYFNLDFLKLISILFFSFVLIVYYKYCMCYDYIIH